MESTAAIEMKRMEFLTALEMTKINATRNTAFEVEKKKFWNSLAVAVVFSFAVLGFGINLRIGLTGKVTDIEKFVRSLKLKPIKLIGGASVWTSVRTVVVNITSRLINSKMDWLQKGFRK